MFNYELALDQANAELRAYESYKNLNEFLNDSIALEAINIKNDWQRIKTAIANFFKKILEAIKRFIAQIFGQGTRVLNSNAINMVVQAIISWKTKMNDINPNTDTDESSKVLNDIKSECAALEDKVQAYLAKHTDKSEYKVISKSEFNVLYTFSNYCEDIINRISGNIQTIDNPSEKEHQIFDIMNMVSYVESLTMTVISRCAWESRPNSDETLLEKPIPIEFT